MPSDSLSTWLARLAPSAAVDATNSVRGGPVAEASSSAAQRESLLLSVARPAMACEFEVLLNQHQYADGADLAIASLKLVEQIESLLSVYKPRSDLSTLNKFGAARSVSISSDTTSLLALAQDIYRWTDRAFDMTSGSLSEVWGFSRRRGRKPSNEEIVEALGRVGTEFLEIDRERLTAKLLKAGVTLNPGGIGKGYALDRAAGRLNDAGILDFMIHGGLSSVVARGDRQHPKTGGGWLVSMKHPWRWDEHMGTIRLRDQALGTSGSGKQFFHFGGKRYSHIIDPRTGWPAQSMMSTTVVCASGAIADALATAFFVMGVEATKVFCQKHRQIAAILVYQDPTSGKPNIELCNVTDDMWQPNLRGTSPV